jgi:hypothetical protein
MDTKNCVLMLMTKAQSGKRTEYRVAYCTALVDMARNADYPSERYDLVNRKWLLDVFRGARATMDANEAVQMAMEIERREWGILYKGMRIINLSHIFFPAPDRARHRRHRLAIQRRSGERVDSSQGTRLTNPPLSRTA